MTPPQSKLPYLKADVPKMTPAAIWETYQNLLPHEKQELNLSKMVMGVFNDLPEGARLDVEIVADNLVKAHKAGHGPQRKAGKGLGREGAIELVGLMCMYLIARGGLSGDRNPPQTTPL